MTGEDDRVASAYLARLGFAAADVDLVRAGERGALERVVAAHVARIPFENLRVMAGHLMRTDAAGAVDRIVTDRAGGVCYELNGALAWLLGELGLRPRLWSAAVRRNASAQDGGGSETEQPAWGIDGGHVAIEIDAADGPALIDVGFGGEGIVGPAPHPGMLVTSPAGRVYRVVAPVGAMTELAAQAEWQSTSPESIFTRSPIVSTTGAGVTTTLFASAPGAAPHGDAAGDESAEDDAAPYAYSSVITTRDGSRSVAALTYDEATAFAEREFGLGVALPRVPALGRGGHRR